MGKKGVIGMSMIDILSLITLVIIFIVFFILFKYHFDFSSAKMGLEMGNLNNDVLLLNYLRTPYGNKVVADLVVESVENNNFEGLDIFTQEIFKDSNLCFKLFINSHIIDVCPAEDSGKKFRDFRIEELRYAGEVFIPTKNKGLINVKIVNLREYYE